MSQSNLELPTVLSINRLVQEHLTSGEFLPNNVWKIAFSPCSLYLAVPKQDIYGRYCVLVIRSSNWHSNTIPEKLPIEHQFYCGSAICSLAFGQRHKPMSGRRLSIFDPELLLVSSTARDLIARRRSSVSVNRRYDFNKNLFLAAGLADGKINIWNVNTGELTLILKDHQSAVCGVDLTSGTMQLASCSHDTTIKLWNLLDDGNMYKTLQDWKVVINAVKWSPDETLLCAVGPYELVVLYETKKWEQLFKLQGHLHSVSDCAFSSDSGLLLTASYDTRVCLWSTTTGQLLKVYPHVIPNLSAIYAGGDNGSFVRSIAVTKFNHLLITVCDDNKIRWFSLASDRSNKVLFERPESNGLCVVTTSNGQTTAVSTRNGEVHLLSSLCTPTTRQVPSLKFFCRLSINSNVAYQRPQIVNLSVPQHLIHYLCYKDIQMK